MVNALGRVGCLTLVLLFLGISTAHAQIEWDPDRYVELTQEGQTLYRQALELPISEAAARRSALFDAASILLEGLEMLRSALLRGEVEAERDEALADFYTLSENLVVIFLDLDQCTAAELLLRQALTHPELLPEGGAEHLESLQPRFDECRTRVSESATAWDPDHYDGLVASASSWGQRARSAEDEANRRNALFESFQSQLEALELLRRALLSEQAADEVGRDFADELYERYDALISVMLELGFCGTARRRLQEVAADATLMPSPRSQAVLSREGEVAACESRLEVSSGASPSVELERPPILPWALIGVAGAATVSIVTLEAASVRDRDEFDQLQNECAVGPCDLERADRISETLDRRRTATIVLTGLAVTTAVTGTILLLIDRDGDEEPEVAEVQPLLGPSFAGAVLQVRY
jgi:hypothetical protein